jgi:hypothetical protein
MALGSGGDQRRPPREGRLGLGLKDGRDGAGLLGRDDGLLGRNDGCGRGSGRGVGRDSGGRGVGRDSGVGRH